MWIIFYKVYFVFQYILIETRACSISIFFIPVAFLYLRSHWSFETLSNFIILQTYWPSASPVCLFVAFKFNVAYILKYTKYMCHICSFTFLLGLQLCMTEGQCIWVSATKFTTVSETQTCSNRVQVIVYVVIPNIRLHS